MWISVRKKRKKERKNVCLISWRVTSCDIIVVGADPPRQRGGSPERQLARCVDCGRALLVHSERGRHGQTHPLG